jgi:4'-phosphopantetheinyl transferase
MLLLFTRLENENDDFEFIYRQLDISQDFHDRLARYYQKSDRNRSIAGRYLLLKALELSGCRQRTLKDIKADEFQKPGFDGFPEFNISHAGKIVVCALSFSGRVGVDVEEHRLLPFHEFFSVFSEREIESINQAEEKTNQFYKLWCRKEALIKGDGRGFSLPVQEIEILNQSVTLENCLWHLHDIGIHGDYSVSVANEGEKREDIFICELFLNP